MEPNSLSNRLYSILNDKPLGILYQIYYLTREFGAVEHFELLVCEPERLTGAVDFLLGFPDKVLSLVPDFQELEEIGAVESELKSDLQKFKTPDLVLDVGLFKTSRKLLCYSTKFQKILLASCKEAIIGKPKGVEKAEDWLRWHIVSRPEDLRHQESITYFLSRKHDESNAVDAIAKEWKCISNNHILKESNKSNLSESETRTAIESGGSWIPLFWEEYRCDDCFDYFDFTMLRIADWAEFGGYEIWWKCWARYTREELVVNQGDPSWLFHLLRCDKAISVLGSSAKDLVRGFLQALGLNTETVCMPKRMSIFFRNNGDEADLPAIAAAVVFARTRLGEEATDISKEMAEKACDFLFSTQDVDGFWQSSYCRNGCINTTAMALHALAFFRPKGWINAAKLGREWLLDNQDEMGYWRYESSPYMTVFVLDSLIITSKDILAVENIEAGSLSLTFVSKKELYPSGDKKNKEINLYLGKYVANEETHNTNNQIFKGTFNGINAPLGKNQGFDGHFNFIRGCTI